jgi:molybdate transport system substrate-binding protein
MRHAIGPSRRRLLHAGAAILALPWPLAAESGSVRILAAASLKDLFDALSARWVSQGGQRPIVTLGGTPMLVRQLEQGMPADLIITADALWMDRLEQASLLRPGSRRVLAGNRLVLIAPQRSTVSLQGVPGMPIASALRGGRLAVADVKTVPAGRYAKAALQSLGVWDAVSGQLAQTENVRAALALVAREEAALGITYATDARAERSVRVVAEFDPALHPPITYPMALTARADRPEAAALLTWLGSPDALGVMQSLGFSAPAAVGPSAAPAR